jgi:hypothetical protein
MRALTIMKRISLALILGVAVTACLSARLVTPYDEKIETGLNDYYENADKFILQMVSFAMDMNDAGRYDRNREYYVGAGAKLDALLLRAKANEPGGKCLGGALGPVDGFLGRVLSAGVALPEMSELMMEIQRRPEGNCTVQVIYGVKINNELMEALHRRNTFINKTVGDILKDTVEQGVRIALTAELAKKNGTRGGS